MVGVILTLIYGVGSVAAQSEAGIHKLCTLIEENFPEVAKLLRKRRYVDDIAKSFKSKEDRAKMADDLDRSLAKVSMTIKGYTNSGELPPENCTKDGISVTMLGYKWYSQLDIYMLNLLPPHFTSKIRGKLALDTEFFGKGYSRSSTS